MRPLATDLDAELVRRCLDGSEHAWNEFYSRFIGLVRGVARRRAPFAGDARDDLVQEAFAAIVKSLETYDPARPLDTYVAAIAERVCISEYRRRAAAKRDAATDPVDLHDNPDGAARSVASDADSQEDRLVLAESVHMLRGALDALDRECREILRMRYFDEKPYREIAETLGAPANTLAVKALRCLEQLKRRYRRSKRKGDPK